jgi:hypothetical protein
VVALTGNDWDLPNFMLSRPYGDFGHSFLLGALLERLHPPELTRTPESRVYQRHYLAMPEEVPQAYRHMVGFDAYRRALARMLAIAKELDAQLVLFSDCVSTSGPGGPSCRYPFASGQYEIVRDELYRDPRVTLCPWRLSQAELIPGDGHPTEAGHRSLARQLLACMRRFGIAARPKTDTARHFSVANPALTIQPAWPLEEGPVGAFRWTQARTELTVRGLTPGARYAVTLRITDAGGCPHVGLEGSDGASEQVETLGPGDLIFGQPLTADRGGVLHAAVVAKPWRPKDRMPGSSDERLLGVALGEVVLEEALPR